MKVWQLLLKVYLKKDIPMEECQIEISKIIDRSLAKDIELLNFHNNNQYKNYTFSSFYPIERDKIYLAGNIYTVTIRTVEERIARHFQKFLEDESSKTLKAIVMETKIVPKRYIERIYSITSVVAKFESGYWRTNESIEVFERRLKENLIKKYNNYIKQTINEKFDFFTYIRFDNKTPIATKYKDIRMLGDKITLNIADNNLAQDLAYFSLGTGLLEMNARGYGYVNCKWL